MGHAISNSSLSRSSSFTARSRMAFTLKFNGFPSNGSIVIKSKAHADFNLMSLASFVTRGGEYTSAKSELNSVSSTPLRARLVGRWNSLDSFKSSMRFFTLDDLSSLRNS